MANAPNGFALYSAFSQRVYGRAYVDKHADQPLAIPVDGSPMTGETDQTGIVIARSACDAAIQDRTPSPGRPWVAAPQRRLAMTGFRGPVRQGGPIVANSA